MTKYKSSAELKSDAKEHLFGKYGTLIGAMLIVFICSMLLTALPSFFITIDSTYSMIIYILVSFIASLFTGILISGNAFLYLKVTCGQPVTFGDFFLGIRMHPDKALLIQLFLTVITYLCTGPSIVLQQVYIRTGHAIWMLATTLTLVIGSIILTIVNLMYSQCFYLLQDFPDHPVPKLLKMSRHIMKGNKGRLFYIQISFIPFFFLGLLSCCIAFLWIVPYITATMAGFYMDVVQNSSHSEDQ